MDKKERPETIDNRWDVLYRDYPAVYEEWGRIGRSPEPRDVFADRFPFEGKVVADIGSGTGISTLTLAQRAEFVFGVEPEDSMRETAIAKQREQHIENVRFVKGTGESIPLGNDSVDMAAAMTAGGEVAKTAEEMERIVRPGGVVVRADVAPGWYGGQLNPVITGKPRDESTREGTRDWILAGRGYEYFDWFSDQDFGTVEKAVSLYGFIFGMNAIEHIKEHQITVIQWKGRCRYKRME